MDLTLVATDELLAQKKEIEAELLGRIDEELANIEQRRSQLLAMKPAAKPEEPTKKKRAKSSRPPKFRNPSNPEQTWTGLGKPPIWISEHGRDACLIPVEG